MAEGAAGAADESGPSAEGAAPADVPVAALAAAAEPGAPEGDVAVPAEPRRLERDPLAEEGAAPDAQARPPSEGAPAAEAGPAERHADAEVGPPERPHEPECEPGAHEPERGGVATVRLLAMRRAEAVGVTRPGGENELGRERRCRATHGRAGRRTRDSEKKGGGGSRQRRPRCHSRLAQGKGR